MPTAMFWSFIYFVIIYSVYFFKRLVLCVSKTFSQCLHVPHEYVDMYGTVFAYAVYLIWNIPFILNFSEFSPSPYASQINI